MFSSKNSTLMPLSLRENNSQANHLYSSGGLPNSNDMYSQSQRYSNILSQQEPKYHLNNWSQNCYSSQQSPQNDLKMKNYMGKPLLFNSRSQLQEQGTKHDYPTRSSVNQLYDLQRKQNDVNGKEHVLKVLENCEQLMKENTNDFKTYLEELKCSLDKSTDLKTEIEAILSSNTNSEELLGKVREAVSDCIANEVQVLKSGEDLKEKLLKLEGEVSLKNEKISQLENEIEKLSSNFELANEKEIVYLEDQNVNLNKLVSNSSSSSEMLKGLCRRGMEQESALKHVMEQNMRIFQSLSSLSSWQKSTNDSLSNMKNSLSSVSVNVVNAMSTNGNNEGTHQTKSVVLPMGKSRGLRNQPSLPQHTRWFDVNGKPSPVAFVQPSPVEAVYQKSKSKANESRQTRELIMKLVPTFDSSDESDGNDISDVVEKVVSNEQAETSLRHPLSEKNVNNAKPTPSVKPIPSSRLTSGRSTTYSVQPTPGTAGSTFVEPTSCNAKAISGARPMVSVKSTPGLYNEEHSEKSPYIQRSIRRFGKIRRMSYSPAAFKKRHVEKQAKENLADNCTKKKLVTLNDHWASDLYTSDA